VRARFQGDIDSRPGFCNMLKCGPFRVVGAEPLVIPGANDAAVFDYYSAHHGIGFGEAHTPGCQFQGDFHEFNIFHYGLIAEDRIDKFVHEKGGHIIMFFAGAHKFDGDAHYINDIDDCTAFGSAVQF
jgi:hypothetical protein